MRYFTIKNFRKFQHYKDRCPPWIKLHRCLLDDYECNQIPDDSAYQLILIWLFASQKLDPKDPTKDVQIPLDPDWLKGQIKVKGKMNLKPLFNYGFLVMLPEAEQLASEVLHTPYPEERREESEAEAETEKRRVYLAQEAWKQKWLLFPKEMRIGKNKCEKIYMKKVKSKKDEVLFDKCRDNYIAKVKHDHANGFPERKWQNGATFMNNYEDYEDLDVDTTPKTAQDQGFSV